MGKFALLIALVAVGPLLIAQQTLNNESVIKLCKAGLSDDLIVSTINATAGVYDTSADGLISLKTAGASDKVVAAIVRKSTTVPQSSAGASAPRSIDNSSSSPQAAQSPVGDLPQASAGQTSAQSPVGPRVFLTSASKGSQWNAARDQSMEMSKDFERDCPGVRITISQNTADYTVLLNHIEHGFVRDNQIQIANKDGDLISRTKEGGSIRGDIKKACEAILSDWAKK